MDATQAAFNFLDGSTDRTFQNSVKESVIAEFEKSGGPFFPARVNNEEVYVVMNGQGLTTYALSGTDVTVTDYGVLRGAVTERDRAFVGGRLRDVQWIVRHDSLPGDLLVTVERVNDADRDAVWAVLDRFTANG